MARGNKSAAAKSADEEKGGGPRRLDHVAIAVRDLEEALEFYRDQFDLPCLGIETVEEQGVRVAKLDAGNTHIELLEPLSPESAVGRFLAQRGPGIHHICIGVADIACELQTLKDKGARLVDDKVKVGAGGAQIVFVHPKCTGGVLIELSQPGDTVSKKD